ncbi:hypothetical protein [Candidatus Similichlamydia epinepheli]|uniref:hypothetical protein n=1 Tax=Candidatus Similichlamydia epinepheli TaxID=1903953 RepID=UPI001957AC5E|nr:hypothetical protein [Candidatus Similichlamydia epinepheli]
MASFQLNDVGVPPRVEGPHGGFYNTDPPTISEEGKNRAIALWRNAFVQPIQGSTVESLSEFFYAQFFPYVSEEFLSGTSTDIVQGGSASRKYWYETQFMNAMVEWGRSVSNSFRTNLNFYTYSGSGLISIITNFAQFIERSSSTTAEKIKNIQENVILFCLNRLIEVMGESQRAEHITSLSLIRNYYAMNKAQEELGGIPLPVVRPSSSDARIPDPESVVAQQEALLKREEKRQSFNISKDESRLTENNLQFIQENSKQFSNTFDSIFERQKTVLEALLRH